MARIIQLPAQYNGTKALALGYRELLQYNLNIADWNELKIAFSTVFLDNTYNYVYDRAQSLSGGLKERPAIGLKYNDNAWLEDGGGCLSLFGLGSTEILKTGATGGEIRIHSGRIQAFPGSNVAAHHVNPGIISGYPVGNYTVNSSADVFTGMLLHFTVVNKGATNQQIRCYLRTYSSQTRADVYGAGGVITDETFETGIGYLQAQNFSSFTVNWVTAEGTAAPLPTTFFMYWGPNLSRLGIQALRVEKIN